MWPSCPHACILPSTCMVETRATALKASNVDVESYHTNGGEGVCRSWGTASTAAEEAAPRCGKAAPLAPSPAVHPCQLAMQPLDCHGRSLPRHQPSRLGACTLGAAQRHTLEVLCGLRNTMGRW